MQFAQINEFGEIVCPYAIRERIKGDKSLQSILDWYQNRRILLPMNMEAVQKIAVFATQLGLEVKDNKKYDLSITNPERLVHYYGLKRHEMSSTESRRDALQNPLKEQSSGSSSTRISGSWTSAIARFKRRCFPPERVRACRVFQSDRGFSVIDHCVV